MVEKDNPKVETEEDRRNKLIEETRRHTEELNRKLEQRERNHNIAYKAKKLGEVVNNFGERVFTMDYLNTLSALQLMKLMIIIFKMVIVKLVLKN